MCFRSTWRSMPTDTIIMRRSQKRAIFFQHVRLACLVFKVYRTGRCWSYPHVAGILSCCRKIFPVATPHRQQRRDWLLFCPSPPSSFSQEGSCKWVVQILCKALQAIVCRGLFTSNTSPRMAIKGNNTTLLLYVLFTHTRFKLFSSSSSSSSSRCPLGDKNCWIPGS